MGYPIYIINMTVVGGYSGSPVFIGKTLKVIGVFTQRIYPTTELWFRLKYPSCTEEGKTRVIRQPCLGKVNKIHDLSKIINELDKQ